MHQWTILISNCIHKEELLNGGEPLCKQQKAFTSLCCANKVCSFRLFPNSNTTSLASKDKENKLVLALNCALTTSPRGQNLRAHEDGKEASLGSSIRLS